MSTIGDIYEGLGNLPEAVLSEADKHAVYSTLEFLGALPDDLDTASASYYLNKEFKRNDTGIDTRYEVSIYTAEDDDWDDDEEDWGDEYYCCEDCG